MTERRIPEYLTKSFRMAADRIEGGDFAGGLGGVNNAISIAIAAIVAETYDTGTGQACFDIQRGAIDGSIEDLPKVFNKDSENVRHRLHIVAKENCDGGIDIP
jgi:hypothetical protein